MQGRAARHCKHRRRSTFFFSFLFGCFFYYCYCYARHGWWRIYRDCDDLRLVLIKRFCCDTRSFFLFFFFTRGYGVLAVWKTKSGEWITGMFEGTVSQIRSCDVGNPSSYGVLQIPRSHAREKGKKKTKYTRLNGLYQELSSRPETGGLSIEPTPFYLFMCVCLGSPVPATAQFSEFTERKSTGNLRKREDVSNYKTKQLYRG